MSLAVTSSLYVFCVIKIQFRFSGEWHEHSGQCHVQKRGRGEGVKEAGTTIHGGRFQRVFVARHFDAFVSRVDVLPILPIPARDNAPSRSLLSPCSWRVKLDNSCDAEIYNRTKNRNVLNVWQSCFIYHYRKH